MFGIMTLEKNDNLNNLIGNMNNLKSLHCRENKKLSQLLTSFHKNGSQHNGKHITSRIQTQIHVHFPNALTVVVSAVVLQYGQVCHTGSFVVNNLISCGLSSVSTLVSPLVAFSGSYSSCGFTFNGS